VGKNKLSRWAEMVSFNNVIQPETAKLPGEDHPLKGRWRSDVFFNGNPVILELGCGKGEYTIGLASRFPQNNYIGIDIKGARIWRGAKTAHEGKMPNVAFLRTRIEFIDLFFNENEIDEIWITFPDPYTGKRNSNKRLTCPWFLNKYRNFLKDNGIIYLKTDNTELYEYTLRLAEKNNLSLIKSTRDLYRDVSINDIFSIKTHYESLFLKEKMKINFLSFRLGKNCIIHD
jgi:tRNA (guanine-N7-)-methyltransferase